MSKRLGLFLLFLALNSCTTISNTVMPPDYLSHEVAIDRSTRLSHIEYQISVQLDPQQERFTGDAQISFDLKDTMNDIPLDFREGKVNSFTINNTNVQRPVSIGPHVILPKEYLLQGQNKVSINYSQAYQNTGVGLHRFTDPEDKQIYIYTQFEPFDANRFAPLFDQPDLKATLKLTVTAPQNWEVITAAKTENISTANNGLKTWVFQPTASISTYLYALHAGPYAVWKDQYKNIPLRLFSRKSLARYVDHKEWFKITRQGFEFFEKYFDYAYPFQKYDQILAPEFNAGAMENVAAVTFSETFVSRGRETRQEKQNTANVILHEMAHMWFGNLTTMRWWNGLWLNETFATYMATLALSANTEYSNEAWQEFFGEKSWAMYEDQLVTTHPIEGIVENTEQAFSNFDGITYGKGAAVMKQLSLHIGTSNFQKGVQAYFKKHAYQNTELSDFIDSLTQSSGISLTEWTNTWLKTTGVDSVSWKSQCDTGKLHKLNIEHPGFSASHRIHTLNWTSGNLVSNQWKESATQKIVLDRAHLEIDVRTQNITCPDFVVLNAGDHAYMKVVPNAEQVKWLKNNISQITDPLNRIQLWHSLWESVRDQNLNVQDYFKIVTSNWTKESSPRVIGFLIETVGGMDSGGTQSVFNYWPQMSDSDRAQRLSAIKDVEKLLTASTLDKKLTLDTRTRVWDGLVSIAETNEFRDHLLNLFVSSKFPIVVDQDRRWDLIHKLCSLNAIECENLINKELIADRSERATRSALAARASRPNVDSKRTFLAQISNPKSNLTYDQVRSISRSLFPAFQNSIKGQFETELFNFLKDSLAGRPEHFQETLANNLSPNHCESTSNTRLKSFLKDATLGEIPTRTIKVALQEDERCLAIRAKSTQAIVR